MGKPIVAIVGRPNVGKSTLFNIFANSRISIVEDTPGVTRDRLYADTEWLDNEFMMVDTGGIEIMNTDKIAVSIRQQAQIAIAEADVILFVCDARAGITHEDAEVAKMLRQSKKPIVLAINKADSPKQEMEIFEFYNLGIGEPIQFQLQIILDWVIYWMQLWKNFLKPQLMVKTAMRMKSKWL